MVVVDKPEEAAPVGNDNRVTDTKADFGGSDGNG